MVSYCPPCRIPRCANRQSTVTDRGLEEIPHPIRPDCRSLDDVAAGLEMGPDTEVVTNEHGASQSKIPTAFATMPLRAAWEVAKLQKYGDDKYGVANWRGIPETDHIEHALAHLFAHLQGDTTDDHLTHAAWRLLAALEIKLGGGRDV